MADFNLTNLALKVLTPTNTILMDDKGLPSVMVRIPKFKISDVIVGGSDSTHPAFIVNGQEVDAIYISKYQNVVYDGRAYSLPLEDPKASINFETALSACTAKGRGWHLMTRAEWAAIALWCRKNNLMPKGNNNYGKDSAESAYVAIPTLVDSTSGQTQRVATGSGPLDWSHDKTQAGIWDLNGNVSEWLGGYRTVEGEIQILANNNAADLNNSQLVGSAAWQAILPDGSLVAPGTAGTLKWDYTELPTGGSEKPFKLNTTIVNKQAAEADGTGGISFQSLTAESGVNVPELLKALALFPADTGDHGGDRIYMRNIGERLSYAGGSWSYGGFAGVFFLFGIFPRSGVYSGLGFRSAFVALST